METFFYLLLFILGLLFGSFGSVIIYRLKSGEKGIISGRSKCGSCNRELGARDLIPLLSWICNRGKCRQCKEKISCVYPFLELSTGIVFLCVGVFMIDINLIQSLDIVEISKFFFWLSISFITILYIFYDILFMEIHEGIMGAGILLACVGLIANYLGFGIVDTVVIDYGQIIDKLFFVLIFLLFLFLGIFYTIMLKGLHEVYDIILLVGGIIGIFLIKIYVPEIFSSSIMSGIIGALGIFVFFYLQIFLSRGRALGGGDLRIGMMIGLLMGMSYSIPAIFLGYIVGSVIGICILIKNKKVKGNTEIPFGPFLGIGFFLTIFGKDYIDFCIENYFLYM